MKKVLSVLLIALLLCAFGCAKKDSSHPADGVYSIDVTLTGGSGKASIESPAVLTVLDGGMTLKVVWSSDHYDYMLVDGQRYEPAISDGHSTFVIPIKTLDETLWIIADTTAMSTPHEIEYGIIFDPSSLTPAS